MRRGTNIERKDLELYEYEEVLTCWRDGEVRLSDALAVLSRDRQLAFLRCVRKELLTRI